MYGCIIFHFAGGCAYSPNSELVLNDGAYMLLIGAAVVVIVLKSAANSYTSLTGLGKLLSNHVAVKNRLKCRRFDREGLRQLKLITSLMVLVVLLHSMMSQHTRFNTTNCNVF